MKPSKQREGLAAPVKDGAQRINERTNESRRESSAESEFDFPSYLASVPRVVIIILFMKLRQLSVIDFAIFSFIPPTLAVPSFPRLSFLFSQPPLAHPATLRAHHRGNSRLDAHKRPVAAFNAFIEARRDHFPAIFNQP